MRYVVIGVLLLILASLGSALFYMVTERGRDSRRMVKALAIRVGLSIALFTFLMAGYYFGVIPARL
jgi:hypothetical protein